MKIAAKLIFAAVIAVACSAAEASDPQITSVSFQRCTTQKSCSEVTRWNEAAPTLRSASFQVVATVANSATYSDDFFLLTTTEYMIAPLYTYSVADLEKLKTGNEVSWSQLTRDDDMRAIVLRGVRRETKRPVALRIIDVRKLVKTSFSEPDAMWPWLVRVTAILVNRRGQILSTQSGILELVPSAQRTKASTDPLGRRREPGS